MKAIDINFIIWLSNLLHKYFHYNLFKVLCKSTDFCFKKNKGAFITVSKYDAISGPLELCACGGEGGRRRWKWNGIVVEGAYPSKIPLHFSHVNVLMYTISSLIKVEIMSSFAEKTFPVIDFSTSNSISIKPSGVL